MDVVQRLFRFFLHCHYFECIRLALTDELAIIDSNNLNLADNEIMEVFFVIVVNQSRPKHDVNRISGILNTTLNFYFQIREIFRLTFFKDICFCYKVEPPFTHS